LREELIQYRLRQAKESLAEAELLLGSGKSFRGAVNRAYYAMFYSTLALLSSIKKASAKHSGIIALFDQHFVKTRIFPKEMSKALHRAFDMRQLGDYRELFEIEQKDAEEIIQAARHFINQAKEYLAHRTG